MQVFVYEHLCATAGPDDPGSLLVEGQAMLEAVLADFCRCPGVQVSTLLARHQLGRVSCSTAAVHSSAGGPENVEESFRRLARRADGSLVIAPECGDCLARCCAWVEQEGGRLLGPSTAAVRLTADKLALAHHLHEHDIPTPPCWPVTQPAVHPFPLVCKPRDGAGSQATFLVHDPHQLAEALSQARREGWPEELLAQPFFPGQAVSVSFLAGPDALQALPAAAQHLSPDGRFHYQGGTVPLPAELDQRARRLADRAVRVVPGVFGIFGVDLVLGPADDGSRDQVIEINPRLTTSYIGLRRLACFNLAEVLLAVVRGEPLPALSWSSSPILFRPGGVSLG